MDTFFSKGVGSIEIVKRAIVKTRVTHSRNSDLVTAPRSPEFSRPLASQATRRREALSLSNSASGGVS